MRRWPMPVLLVVLLHAAAGTACSQLVLIDSFAPALGQLAGATFDMATDRVWVYASSTADVRRYTMAGAFEAAVPRPGEATNDVDVDVAPEALSLAGVPVPSGSLLFVNGESGTADVYALDPADGTILATLVTAFGTHHVVGGAWHPARDTLFLIADQNDAGVANTVAEIDPETGAVLNAFAASMVINFGDLEVHGATGNLLVVSNVVGMLRELTPAGAFVRDLAWPVGVGSVSGIGIDEGRDELWLGGTDGTVYHVGLGPAPTTTTSMPSTTTTTSTTSTTSIPTTSTTSTTASTSTTSTSTTSTSTSLTTTTLAGTATLLPGTKLLVKTKKAGGQRLQLLVRDPGVVAATPCEVGGDLVVEAAGAGGAPRRIALDAALWKPIRASKPEKGCKYRKGPVVATVQVKAGKMLKVIAAGSDLGVPLATDPRPVRIEVRHGDVRQCVEFGPDTKGGFKADRKLLARGAGVAAGCPTPALSVLP